MRDARSFEATLGYICNAVCSAIAADPSKAKGYIDNLSELRNIRDALSFAGRDGDAGMTRVVNRASISDIFQVALDAILANEEGNEEDDSSYLDDRRLNTAASLFSVALHRLFGSPPLPGYSYFYDADGIFEILCRWAEDRSWFGGDVQNGAIERPLEDFVILTCYLTHSCSLYESYSTLLTETSKMILTSTNVSRNDKDVFDTLVETLSETHHKIRAVLESGSAQKGVDSLRPQRQTKVQSTDALETHDALEQGIAELNSLIGIESVKNEISRLANFLKIRQQRMRSGLPVASQSLHFVFSGNPGTGKTTVARILAKILYGFQVLNTPKLVEAHRATLVGGYVGQTALKTNKLIAKARDGVLFIDEAYTLANGEAQDFGNEAIATMLKKMEDLRDRLVVIVAGYPEEMRSFVTSNPGLESRFTRFITFDDYHVSEMCRILESMCNANSYRMTQDARANLAILLNGVFRQRDATFGNARFIRNLYERAIGNQSDRLANSGSEHTRVQLSTIEANDLPYEHVHGANSAYDVTGSRWHVLCPGCGARAVVTLAVIGRKVKHDCGMKFRCPWWNLEEESVPGLSGFKDFARKCDLLGYDVEMKQEHP